MKILYTQRLMNLLKDMLNGRSLLPPLLRSSTLLLAGLSLEEGKHLCQHGHRPLLSLHLRQRRFGLGQPEGHVHGAVQLDGGGQRGAGLLRLAGLAYSVPRPRWQWAWSGRMPSSSARARACW